MPQREVIKAVAQQLMALDREAWRLFLNGAASGPEGSVFLNVDGVEIAVKARIPVGVAISLALYGAEMRPPDPPPRETEREMLERRRRELASAPGALAYTDHPEIEPAGWEVRTTDR